MPIKPKYNTMLSSSLSHLQALLFHFLPQIANSFKLQHHNRGMSAEQKVPYELLAEKDKTRYFKQMELWNSKQKKKIKNPSSSYAFFVKKERSIIARENPDVKFEEIGRELGK